MSVVKKVQAYCRFAIASIARMHGKRIGQRRAVSVCGDVFIAKYSGDAASPPDVRKACGLPIILTYILGSARMRGVAPKNFTGLTEGHRPSAYQAAKPRTSCFQ